MDLNQLKSEIIKELKRDFILVPKTPMIIDTSRGKSYVEVVVNFIAGYYQVNPATLKQKTRLAEVVELRQITCYICRCFSGVNVSSSTIGRALGIDHATVLYGIRVVNNRMDVEKGYKENVEVIKQRFVSEYGDQLKIFSSGKA